ncbi:MAG: carbohydrate ABC transporter permease, partial [Gemmatimonadales bacterium]
HRAAHDAARDWATRAAQSAAAYLALVAPTTPGATSYDLARLLAQARGLATLPGWTGVVEVYHGTAPLVRATAKPLDAAAFATLREREIVQALGDAQLVPLKDKDDWDVVGAVAVRPGDVTPRLLNGWTLALLVVLGVTGALAADRRRRKRVIVLLGLTAVLSGLTGYRIAVTGAHRATDGWLMQARVLLGEVGARIPTRSAAIATVRLAGLVRGAELTVGDSGYTGVQRAVVAARPQATTRVRLTSGWLVLTVVPGEATQSGWLAVTLGLAALGVLGVLVVGWIARARARPRELRETLTAWGFLAPATVHLAVFSFGPMVFAGYLALHRWSPLEPVKPFVGLGNFLTLAGDPLVWISLRNTLLYTLHVPVAMAIALGVALVLQHRSGAACVARTVFFLPYVSSLVAVALVWQWMYHADFGLLNYLGAVVGLPPVDWLGNPRTALVAVMVVSIWVQVGYQMIVFLAGLQAIPQGYLDAARVDGANPWQRFWRVTFPLLRPVTLFVLVTGVITSFQVFTLIYVLTDGGPLHATDVLVYRIYQLAWEFLQFGDASALALLLFALLFGATWLQFRLLGKRVDYA